MDYTLLNGEHIYTKDGMDQQINRVTQAIHDETEARQRREDTIEHNLAIETANREQADGELDLRVSSLENYIGGDAIKDEQGRTVTLIDFYREFLKECKDRQTEDMNIEAEFEKYLKFHGEQELNDKYAKLKGKPWVAYRDGNGRIQIKELLGTKEHPFNLTDLYTLTSYQQLGHKPCLIFKDVTGRIVNKELRGGKENALDLTEFAKVNDYDTLINRPWFKYIDSDGEEQLVEIVGGQDNPIDLTKFAGVTDYDSLLNKPYVKYKDGEGEVRTAKLEGGEDHALDLTELSGGKSNYNELDHAFTINGLSTQSDAADQTKDLRLEAAVKMYPESEHYDEHAVYPTDATDVPVNELELESFTDNEITDLWEEV